MITSPCNEYPITPHFYILKLGFTGVYICFLIFALKHSLWVLVRTALLRKFKRVATINVLCKNKEKNIIFHLKIIFFTAVKNCSILHERVFVMRNCDSVQWGDNLLTCLRQYMQY